MERLPLDGAELISIHALREEGDVDRTCGDLQRKNFYPRPPRGGRQASRASALMSKEHFYPRPPRGGRQGTAVQSKGYEVFLSTPSARRATRTTWLP